MPQEPWDGVGVLLVILAAAAPLAIVAAISWVVFTVGKRMGFFKATLPNGKA